MALSQFGGRPGSGSGTGSGAGKEVGELVLVPSSFTSTDFAEAGQAVSSAALPTLYNSLASNATSVATLSPHPATYTSASIVTNARSVASFIRGSETHVIIGGGRIVKTTDGITWTEASALPLTATFEKTAFAADGSVRQYQNVVAGTVGNTSVAIAMSFGKAIAYKTTDGVNWSKFTDAQLDAAAFLNSGTIKGYINAGATLGRNVSFSATKGLMVVPGAKKILATDDGLVWRDVTGTIPTTSFVQATALPVHADSQSLTVFIAPIMYTSVDNGVTWKSATITYLNGTTPTAFTNITRFLGNLYIGGYNGSSVIGFYRTTDLGTTWVGTGGSSVSGSTVSTFNTAMYSDGTTLRVNAFGANRTYSTTDGAAWTLSTSQTAAPFSNQTGIWFLTAQNRMVCTDSTGQTMISTDSINSTIAPTVLLGGTLQLKTPNPPIVEFAKKGTMFVGTFGSGVTTTDIVVGTATSIQTVTMPVADKWIGICYHPKVNKFFLTGFTSANAYTSTDGLTWTALVNGVDLPQSAANTVPVAGGDCVTFVPRVTASTAATYGLIFDDLSMIYVVGNSIQGSTSRAAISTASDDTRAIWIGNGNLYWNVSGLDVVAATSSPQSIGSPVSMSGTAALALAGERFIIVNAAIVYVSTFVKTGLGTTVTYTLPITPNNFCVLVDGSSYTILSQNSTSVYQSGDYGVTWSALPLTGIDKSAVFYGATMLGSTPIVFTSLGVYLGAAGGGVKVIPQYVSTTPGQKYVVKAK